MVRWFAFVENLLRERQIINFSILGEFTMNTSTQPLIIERGDFIELLTAEFTCAKGFGVYAFLSYNDIDALYHRFLRESIAPTVFVRLFVKRFG